MKVHVLSRNPDDYLRETKRDIQKVPRNYDPKLHPFEAPREYIRAMNATKLQKVFAKPFLGALDGHSDGVNCMCKHPTQLSLLVSGACDGEIRLWNLAERKCVKKLQAHEGMIHSMCIHPSGSHLFSCGSDQTIKQWTLTDDGMLQGDPVNTTLGKTIFQSISHHGADDIFATSGQQVDIWNTDRSEPVRSFTWGVDSHHSVKFNPVERHMLASCASDRSIILYDMRGSAPLRKVILKLKSNTIAWNPMEAFTFTAANEDFNLYTFDLRNLSLPIQVHSDHVAAVMDVDYSPTGREFVTAGYDKCLRIFPFNESHSREIYHTKRMLKVRVVQWSLDNRFIISGSDEMNIRVWKAQASEKLGVLRPREKTAMDYSEKLKEKFQCHPKVRRIARHRHVPKYVINETREIKEQIEKQKRKEANRRAHSKKGSVPSVPVKKRHFVGEVE